MKQYKNTPYFITENGEVFRDGRKLKLNSNNAGYVSVLLSNGKIRTRKTIHRLVAETYLPNPKNLRQVNHKNGNKLDNRISNLEWCDANYNQNHRVFILKKGVGESCYNSKLTEIDVKYIRENYMKGDSNWGVRAISRKYNVSRKTIMDLLNNKTWRHL